MEIVAGELEWTDVDAENLRKFLMTPTGQRVLPKLMEGAPALLASGETNAIMIRSGEMRAYRILAENFLGMARPEPQQKQAEPLYPSLEDDTKWGDGKKINDTEFTP